jgi:hypothetical protein
MTHPTRRRPAPLDWPLADLQIGQTFIAPLAMVDGTLCAGCGRPVNHLRVLVSGKAKSLGYTLHCTLNRAGSTLEVRRSA